MEAKRVVWESRRLCLPKGAVNVLKRSSIRASASSSGAGFDPVGAFNGEKTLLHWGQGNGWQSAPVNWHPSWWGEWLRVDLPEPVEIDTVVVYGYPEIVRNRPWHAPLHFQVQCLGPNGEWVTLATVRHNRADVIPVTFPAISTASLRVWINRNHFREESGYEGSFAGGDEAPRILEVEAYRLGGMEFWKTESREKEFIVGPNGCAALFFDEAFDERPAVDIERLKVLLTSCGLGVVRLTAEELASPELFSAENFDLFVHPYGRFVPSGSNLYDFLSQGGHLLSFGGRAFTALKQCADGRWIDVGLDPAITVSAARYVDYFRPFREQLTMFSIPNSRFDGVAGVRLNAAQTISLRNVDAACAVEGWMALGAVGELQPIDETRRYAEEGRLPWINHAAREGIHYEKCDTPILWGDGQDENYGSVFAYACSRWVSLVDCLDRFGANRGPLLSLMPHYEGAYRGSCWIFSGVENIDILSIDGMSGVIEDAIRYALTGLTVHSLEPEYACYRPGEEAAFSVILDNTTDLKTEAELRIEARVVGRPEPLMARRETAALEPMGWQRFDFRCAVPTDAELVELSCELWLNGRRVDRIKNGFAVWNADTLCSGPAVTFSDNFFKFDGEPRYVTGARDSGLHLPWQPENNVLGWDALYGMLRDFGMQITSPVHMDWCFPGLGWGTFDNEQPVPEIILRQMEAQAMLAQKHGLIYAPCIFFTYEKIAMQKADVSRRICEVLGARFRDVPGIIFFLFDDGLRHDPDLFNEWTRQCVEGLEASGRRYLVTAEMGFRQWNPDTLRRSAKYLSFANGSNFRQAVGDPAYERLVDLRPVGKSFTLGEFVRRLPAGSAEDFHGYLAPVHVNFGMGYSMAMNWKWSTPYHTIWPSDVVFPGNHVPKAHAYAFRNEALFFRGFRPVYVPAKLMVVAPSRMWLKNSEAFTRYMVALLGRLLEWKIDFGVIDEQDLDLLPPGTSALLLPLPLGLSEDEYRRLDAFARAGGSLFAIGDLGGDLSEGDSRWMRELCGVERLGPARSGAVKGRSLYMDAYMPTRLVAANGETYEVLAWVECAAVEAEVRIADECGRPVLTRAARGAGSVFFMNDLGLDFPASALEEFLRGAGVARLSVEPALGSLHVFETATLDGPVFTAFTYPWDQGVYNLRIQARDIEICATLKDQSMGVFALTREGNGVYAAEAQGDIALNGRKLVAGDCHAMLFALDRTDIAESGSLLILPIAPGELRVPTRCDCVIRGTFENGRFTQLETLNVRDGEFAARFTRPDMPHLFLLVASSQKDAAVQKLESMMMN